MNIATTPVSVDDIRAAWSRGWAAVCYLHPEVSFAATPTITVVDTAGPRAGITLGNTNVTVHANFAKLPTVTRNYVVMLTLIRVALCHAGRSRPFEDVLPAGLRTLVSIAFTEWKLQEQSSLVQLSAPLPWDPRESTAYAAILSEFLARRGTGDYELSSLERALAHFARVYKPGTPTPLGVWSAGGKKTYELDAVIEGLGDFEGECVSDNRSVLERMETEGVSLQPGTMTGVMKLFEVELQAVVAPEPWQHEVMSWRRMVDGHRRGWSTRRPSTAYKAHPTGPITPAFCRLTAPERMRLVIVMDTSGSITGDHGLVDRLMQQLASAAVHTGGRTTLMFVDAAVKEVRDIDFTEVCKHARACALKRVVRNAVVGGGGTDFSPAFEEVKKRRIIPSGLVYLTDLYGTFPQERPSYPVLWVCTQPRRSAPFGKIAVMS